MIRGLLTLDGSEPVGMKEVLDGGAGGALLHEIRVSPAAIRAARRLRTQEGELGGGFVAREVAEELLVLCGPVPGVAGEASFDVFEGGDVFGGVLVREDGFLRATAVQQAIRGGLGFAFQSEWTCRAAPARRIAGAVALSQVLGLPPASLQAKRELLRADLERGPQRSRSSSPEDLFASR